MSLLMKCKNAFRRLKHAATASLQNLRADWGQKSFKDRIRNFPRGVKNFFRALGIAFAGASLLAAPLLMVILYGSFIIPIDNIPDSLGPIRYLYSFAPTLYTLRIGTASVPSFWDYFGHYTAFSMPLFLLWLIVGRFVRPLYALRFFFGLMLVGGLLHFSSLVTIKSFLNASAILAPLFTDENEIGSFISVYFAPKTLFLLVLLLALCVLAYRRFKKNFLEKPARLQIFRRTILVLALLSLIPWINRHNWRSFRQDNVLIQIPYTLYQFFQASDFVDLRDRVEDQAPETKQKRLYVFLLGESVTRAHGHAFGYSRPTTPFFDTDPQVTAFQNAVTPYPSTALVTRGAFNRGPYEHEHSRRNLFNILHKAGFKMAYLTVQAAGGSTYEDIYKSFDTVVPLELSYQNLMDKRDKKEGSPPKQSYTLRDIFNRLLLSVMGPSKHLKLSEDENLWETLTLKGPEPPLSHQYTGDIVFFDPLETFLKQTQNERKRFVFIHLDECHFKYRDRILSKTIPAAFRKLVEIEDGPFGEQLTLDNRSVVASEEERREFILRNIAYYDTCVAYSNHVLKRLADRLDQEKDTQSFFVYESDHGDDVFQTSTTFSHGHYNGRSVFEVPFVLWTNKAYRAAHPRLMKWAAARRSAPFMTDALSYILYNLSDIKLNGETDFSFSPLSPSFDPTRKRIVGFGFKDIDYDKTLAQQPYWYH